MIVTVTLNPALDKTYTASRLIQGQVNRMQTVRNIAGGKGINVTKILRQYKQPVTALGFLGGYTGDYIEDCVRKTGAACRFVRISEETRSSINIIAEDGYVTELLEPGPKIAREELNEFLEEYRFAASESHMVVLSGSIPGGIPTGIYATLIQIAKECGKEVLLDSSGKALAAGVKSNPFMIKPNLRELEFLLGYRIRGTESIRDGALELVKQGVEHVFVSMGKRGLLYAGNGQVLQAEVPDVRVMNTVGCGDSAVASFCMSLMERVPPEEMLRKAAAVSAANATTMESGSVPVEIVEEIYRQVKIKRLWNI